MNVETIARAAPADFLGGSPDDIDFHTVEAAVLLHAEAGLLFLQDHRLLWAKIHLDTSVELQQWSRRAAAEARNWATMRRHALKDRPADAGLEDYLPVLFHTATRSEETRAMKWSDLDFERALWKIPPEASKTGEITGEPHIVPLSAGALEVLGLRRGRKVAPLSAYVFPASSGGYMRHPSRGIATVRKRSCVVDFRR